MFKNIAATLDVSFFETMVAGFIIYGFKPLDSKKNKKNEVSKWKVSW